MLGPDAPPLGYLISVGVSVDATAVNMLFVRLDDDYEDAAIIADLFNCKLLTTSALDKKE